MAVTLGPDFGTNSVRALLVRCESGQESGTSVVYCSFAKGLGNA
jgi:ribulose kinase